MRAALIACLIANANRDPEKHPDPFEITDFLLRFGVENEHKQQSWQEQLAIVEILNIAFGGKDLRPDGANQ